MIRRKPTAIAITSDDLTMFEEELQRKLERQNNNRNPTENGSRVNFDPSDELKPLPGDKARIVRSREERIGIGQQQRN
ncbi:anaphase-promoting complex, subunit CDC26 [Aspergillus carlsbadensis]|nr:anaphase-promoting complex, subunit CDC26 [Aspergillus carlsbadensis]